MVVVFDEVPPLAGVGAVCDEAPPLAVVVAVCDEAPPLATVVVFGKAGMEDGSMK